MTFKPGQSGNPAGRAKGSINRPVHLAIDAVPDALRNVDSLELLRAIMRNPNAPLGLRAQCAGMVLPFEYSRVTRRDLSKVVEVPVPETAEQATSNIAQIGALATAKYIGLDEASELISYQKAFIEAKVASDMEIRLVALEQAVAEGQATGRSTITVVGGLPRLPGAETILPCDDQPGPATPDHPWAAKAPKPPAGEREGES